jgi:hypothetical protein
VVEHQNTQNGPESLDQPAHHVLGQAAARDDDENGRQGIGGFRRGDAVEQFRFQDRRRRVREEFH